MENTFEKDTKIPNCNDEQGWKTYCIGRTPLASSQKLPFLHSIIPLDELTLHKLIVYHVKWMHNDEFTKERAMWIYALLSRLQKPPPPHVASSLRDLLVYCCKVRAKMDNREHPLLSSVNIIIALTEVYFGQGDQF
eukprot:TRINITY_DN5528_c0_g1_i1.p1 TRINITY_DN5528_c0_g1~~TRINITY_DN5528_c0_g1_i1.p1  ORF type:complete len:136 (+),score=22.07 TRINITY_DN5528_c0_g1_i1:280-687(+)